MRQAWEGETVETAEPEQDGRKALLCDLLNCVGNNKPGTCAPQKLLASVTGVSQTLS